MALFEANQSAGIDLHSRVDRHRWCVTWNDLFDFRQRVQKGVSDGDITQSASDDFDPCDLTIGPNLYTVNEQFVKPVTKAAGGMSWALMLHPEGLDCDLFVTHAWQEGVYELVGKVLHSWPQGARHAYICVLANPQNQDIGGLISKPSESPFARSLAAAQWMMVVPNQKGSIYQRLWCAYEAYLAYTQDKVILVARVPSSRIAMASASACTAAVALTGILAGTMRAYFAPAGTSRMENYAFWPATLLPYLGSPIFSSRCLPGLRRACHYGGATFFGYYFAIAWLPNEYSTLKDHSDVAKMQAILLMGMCYFVIAEVDAVRSSLAYAESCQLCQGYSGSILDASCKVQRDADYILKEIRGKAREVDNAIQVLIRAGMWNHSMHKASDVGVDLQGASHISYATPCTAWVVQLMLDLVLLSEADPLVNVLAFANLCMQVLWFAILACRPQDTRAFGIRAMTVVSTVFFSMATTIHILFVHASGVHAHATPLVRTQAFIMLASQTIIIALLVSGLGNVAGWPLCGRCLVQFLLMASICQCDLCYMCRPAIRRMRLRTEVDGDWASDCHFDAESPQDTCVEDGADHDVESTSSDSGGSHA